MTSPTSPLSSRLLGRLVRAALVLTVAATTVAVPAAQGEAHAARVTPGDFTGYGFDQCVAPGQSAMDAWLHHSPFWAVGIYISGDSRGCRSQPNLTPTWVRTQLRNGWRLLPITLGPQASCNPRFPRYRDDVTISPRSTRGYQAARLQGRQEAAKTATAASALGIAAGSTLWYDIEAYDIRNTACRESTLSFLSAWTKKIRALGYVSGVYSSAASGIRALDDVRVTRPRTYALPDRIWVADWNGRADTSSAYIRSDGWLPDGRMKQYQGGHNETWGGVTINIDRNWIDLSSGTSARRARQHCDGVRLSFRRYPILRRDATGSAVTALQCRLTERGFYDGPLDGTMGNATRAAVRSARNALGLDGGLAVGPRLWTALLAPRSQKVIKYGATGERVRGLQRALNAATGARMPVDGVFAGDLATAVRGYQDDHRLDVSGVVTPRLWRMLRSGKV